MDRWVMQMSFFIFVRPKKTVVFVFQAKFLLLKAPFSNVISYYQYIKWLLQKEKVTITNDNETENQ